MCDKTSEVDIKDIGEETLENLSNNKGEEKE